MIKYVKTDKVICYGCIITCMICLLCDLGNRESKLKFGMRSNGKNHGSDLGCPGCLGIAPKICA